MGYNYVVYGQITINVPKKTRPLIMSLVNDTSFSLNHDGNIIHHGGTDGAHGLYQEFKDLIETIREEMATVGYDSEDIDMYGKLIVDFTDYDDAREIMVIAIDSSGYITIFPDMS
jgi:hypothetical protein